MTSNEFIAAIALGGGMGLIIHYGVIAWRNWQDHRAYLASIRQCLASAEKRAEKVQTEDNHQALVGDVWSITQANQRFCKSGDDASPEAMIYKGKPLRNYTVPDLKEIVLGHYYAQIDHCKQILA